MRAGLLLEQAAHCLLSLQPPHTRKFAFQLVLAGLRFDMCGQKGLAQRAYRCAGWHRLAQRMAAGTVCRPAIMPPAPSCPRTCRQVLQVYGGRQWALIEEHLHDVLGRQARDAGDSQAAVQHFMAMLACPHNTPYCQRLYLGQFMEALEQAQAQLVSRGGLAWASSAAAQLSLARACTAAALV